jgi:hypothetical protein
MSAQRPDRIARCSLCHAVYEGGERFCPHDGGAVVDADTADPMVGRTVGGRYFVRRPIGRGGMGVVYEAEHVGLDRRVALKFILDRHSGDRDALHRFHREARTAGRIGHENIIAIADVGETDDGKSYIAMEYLEGRDLGQVLRAGGGMEPSRALHIMDQVLRGLAAAHAQGIVHRDMKPENVFLVERDGATDFVKIMDFGISKVVAARDENVRLTDTGAVVGTPIYMAPEQAQGAPDLDHRVDIYAAGVMLYEMLAGRPPFAATTYPALVAQHLNDPPPPLAELRPDLPAELCAAVHRALEKDPARRWPTALAFAEGLAACRLPGFREDGDTLSMKSSAGRRDEKSGSSGAAPAELGLAAPLHIEVPVFRPAPRRRARASRALLLVGGAAAALSVAVWRGAGDSSEPTAAPVASDSARPAAPSVHDSAQPAAPSGAASAQPAAPSGAASAQPAAPSGAASAQPAAPTEPSTSSTSSTAPTAAAGAAESTASLEIDSGPRGAQVFVDGEHRGRTPVRLDLSVGKHTVRLEMRGYLEVEAEKIVRAGHAETFFAALARRGKRGSGREPAQPGTAPGVGPGAPDPTSAPDRDGARATPDPDRGERKSNPYLDLRPPRP